MIHVSRDNRHAMHKRCSRNKRIMIRARIWNVEGCPTLGNCSINRKDAACECW